jgi:hypothetical protein
MSGGAGRRESQNTGGLDFGSIVCAIKMLVIGSCTGDKSVRDCPSLLTQADLDDSSLFQRREAELSAWALPARELYTGLQHRYMMNGVDAIHHRFGTSACSVKIVSAGYGLVDEEQRLANTRQHSKDSVRNGFGNKQIGWGFRRSAKSCCRPRCCSVSARQGIFGQHPPATLSGHQSAIDFLHLERPISNCCNGSTVEGAVAKWRSPIGMLSI